MYIFFKKEILAHEVTIVYTKINEKHNIILKVGPYLQTWNHGPESSKGIKPALPIVPITITQKTSTVDPHISELHGTSPNSDMWKVRICEINTISIKELVILFEAHQKACESH